MFLQTIKTNVMGTMNMLGLAKRVGARFITYYLKNQNLLLVSRLTFFILL